MRNLLVFSLSLLFSFACAPPAEPPAPAIDLDAERSALMSADEAWYEAFSGSDTPVDAFLNGMEDDARFQFADNPAAHGKGEIRELIEQMVSMPGFAVKWTPTAAEVSSQADLGYTVGNSEMNLEVDGNPVTINGHYVTIWRKQEDGSWKVAFDGGGPSAPPAAPE